MKAMIRFSILLFLVSGLQAVTAQTPTRLRLKQLELAPDTAYVIYSKDAGTAIWKTFSSVLSAGGGVTGPLTSGRIPRATGTYTLSDGVLRDDGTLLALGGATVSGYSFYDYSTGGWRLATGTTAKRPTNAAGVHRYNTSLGYSETANGSAWLQSDFPVGTTNYTLRYNNATTSWVAASNLLNDGTNLQLGLSASYSRVNVGNASSTANATMYIKGYNNPNAARSQLLVGGTTAPTLFSAGNADNQCPALTVYGLWENPSITPRQFAGHPLGYNAITAITQQATQSESLSLYAYMNASQSNFTYNQYSYGYAGYFLNHNTGITGAMTDGLIASQRRDWFFYGSWNESSQAGLTINANNNGVSPNTYTWAGRFTATAPVNTADASAANSVWGIQASASGGKIVYGGQFGATATGSNTALGVYTGASGGTYNWGILSTSGLNGFVGSVLINSTLTTTSTAARLLHVEGEARITDLTTDTPTRIVGADADGDLGAVSEGYGINVTGGALEVDTTQIATQSDLASVSVTTLYNGDGTIATDRTVTIGSDKTLTITSTTPDFPGYLHTKKIGYNATWDLWGDYSLIYTDDYFTNFVQGIIDYDSTVFIRISAGDWGGDNYVGIQMNSAGVLSLTGISGSSSAGLSIGQNTTLGAYGSRLQGAGGVEFDADTGGKFVFQVNNTTEAVIDATGVGINDTSPEKSLDVGGMGKFRQLSGQDNSVIIGTNANAGTGRSASITDAQSSDVAGRFSFTTGTGLTAGEWITLTWAVAFDNPPAVQLFPEDADGASLAGLIYVVPTTTGVSIGVNTNSASYESKTYEFNYIVIQGK